MTIPYMDPTLIAFMSLQGLGSVILEVDYLEIILLSQLTPLG